MNYIKNLIGNSWLHFVVACTVYHFGGWIHNLVIDADPKSIGTLWWFSLIALLMVVIKVEFNQRRMRIDATPPADRYVFARNYWKFYWKHSLMDVLMGLLGAVFGLLPFWTR